MVACILKAEAPKHKPGSPWENWWLPTTSQLHFFALYNLYLEPFLDDGSWSLSQRCTSCTATFAVKICSQMGRITSRAWKNSGNLEIVRVPALEELPRQARLSLHDARMVPAWCNWRWNVKSTIGKAELPIHNTKLAGYRQNFAASLFCTAKSIFREWQLAAVPKLWFLHSCFCCRDLGSNGLKNKHGLEQHFWHLAFTASRVAPLRVARLGWFPSQANLPLHGAWRWTAQVCHWPWDVKATIRKAVLPKHNTKLDCIRKTGAYLQLRSFTILHYGKTRMVPKPSKFTTAWLHGGWRRTPKTCQWSWNVESTIGTAELLKHSTKLDCIRKSGGYLQLRSFTFLHCKICIQRTAAGSRPEVVVLAQLLLL